MSPGRATDPAPTQYRRYTDVIPTSQKRQI
jgi:hypothetical protein